MESTEICYWPLPAFDESTRFRVAYAYEQATLWRSQTPVL
jgi:hypothetical protein